MREEKIKEMNNIINTEIKLRLKKILPEVKYIKEKESLEDIIAECKYDYPHFRTIPESKIEYRFSDIQLVKYICRVSNSGRIGCLIDAILSAITSNPTRPLVIRLGAFILTENAFSDEYDEKLGASYFFYMTKGVKI